MLLVHGPRSETHSFLPLASISDKGLEAQRGKVIQLGSDSPEIQAQGHPATLQSMVTLAFLNI